MKTYHNDPAIKAKYLARVKAHRLADELIQGTGWEKGKGCAVGCTLENYDHSQYPVELGVAEGLARLEDHIFEALPPEDAMSWPEQFLAAIPEGIDEHKQVVVLDQFQIFWLERQKTQIDGEKYPQVIAAINQTIALLNRAISGDEPSKDEWRAAESAAESAAWSAAESAAWSAARSAAESAARSAAWSAAVSAAWSAGHAEAKAKRDWLLSALAALKQ
jgi:hypothetical protein